MYNIASSSSLVKFGLAVEGSADVLVLLMLVLVLVSVLSAFVNVLEIVLNAVVNASNLVTTRPERQGTTR